MSLDLLWTNFVAYSLQIGLLIGLAALAPAALRLRSPRAKLAYWHLLLVTCLLLPMIRPWRRQVVVENVTVTTRLVFLAPNATPQARSFTPVEMALALLALGAVGRLGWLAVGFWRLGLRRRRSRPFTTTLPWPSRAELRLSDDVVSPVTFGFRRPVVLLPPQFPQLDRRAREAILCHELLHVKRADWLFTVAEELVRAIFWFHPAIWWLLGEIQLAREQAVDREVIRLTQAKEEYVDALLAIAGAKAQPDLAPAPLFLRKRHLKHRVVSILKETRMSRSRLLSALAASVCAMVAACWLVTNTFPLAAAPQVVSDSPGVSVDIGAATLMHRSPVAYPAAARDKRIQGAVVVELTFDGSGNVADARVISGPEELRKAALQSVLQWHFAHEAPGNKRQVTISFQADNQPLVQGGSTSASVSAGMPVPTEPQAAARALQQANLAMLANDTPANRARVAALEKAVEDLPRREGERRTIRSVSVIGVSDQMRSEILSRIKVRVGDVMTGAETWALIRDLRQFDEHLSVNALPVGENEVALTVVGPVPNPVPRPMLDAVATDAPDRLKIGGNLQSTKLIQQARPVYPPDAKAARIQGVVKMSAVIAKDGTVKMLEVISGHPLLVPSAIDAVKTWVYQPTLFNGNPVEVQTQIDVNYTLGQ